MIDTKTLFKLGYGLFVLTARDGEKDNGCIINTASQVANAPNKIMISVNKNNYTHDMIVKTGRFNLSVLTESVDFTLIQHYGFQSGRDTQKIYPEGIARSENGIAYIPTSTNAFISCEVTDMIDCTSHTLFLADITEAEVLSDERSVTYQYYFDHIKPKPQKSEKKGYVCKVCGYVYEGDELPEDFICPVCKHPASDFEPLNK
ncbi:MAG: flavin reductase [Eubacterium sp.]